MSEKKRLRERQVETAEAQTGLLAQLVGILERPEKTRRRSQLNEVYLAVPGRFLHGSAGLRTLAKVPGFAGLWTKTVPKSYLLRVEGRDRRDHTILLCPCGAQTVLDDVPLTECAGGCGRWLLLGRNKVFVHRFAPTP